MKISIWEAFFYTLYYNINRYGFSKKFSGKYTITVSIYALEIDGISKK